MHNFSA